MYLQLRDFCRLALVFSLLPLAACGGAPSEGELQQALKNALVMEFGRDRGAMNADQVQKLEANIKKVKVIGCNEVGDKSYKCEFSLEVDGKTGKDAARFVKGERGWEVARK